jgi:CBS domain-containing protein
LLEFVDSAKEGSMRVSEAMSRDVCVASPDQSICDVACSMAQLDAGAMPVGDNDRLVGMITDRDIAVRAVAAGKGPDTPVRDVMTPEVKYCYEDEDLDHVAQNMAELRVRRLPVLNRDKRLVGILSLGDLALSEGRRAAGAAVRGISRPGGPHSQSTAS